MQAPQSQYIAIISMSNIHTPFQRIEYADTWHCIHVSIEFENIMEQYSMNMASLFTLLGKLVYSPNSVMYWSMVGHIPIPRSTFAAP